MRFRKPIAEPRRCSDYQLVCRRFIVSESIGGEELERDEDVSNRWRRAACVVARFRYLRCRKVITVYIKVKVTRCPTEEGSAAASVDSHDQPWGSVSGSDCPQGQAFRGHVSRTRYDEMHADARSVCTPCTPNARHQGTSPPGQVDVLPQTGSATGSWAQSSGNFRFR